MKKIWLFLMGICVAVGCYAKDFETKAVLLQALDKTTGRTSFLTLKVGEPYTYGDLVVTVEKCMKRPPEETPENSVYLTVREKEDEEIFKGWMFSSNPALSAMDHPVYDIWVVECKDNNLATEVIPVPVSAEVEEENESEPDTEELED